MYLQKVLAIKILHILVVLSHYSAASVSNNDGQVRHIGWIKLPLLMEHTLKQQSHFPRNSTYLREEKIFSMNVTNTGITIRSKRSSDLDAKTEKCTVLQKESIISDCISNGFNTVGGAIPGGGLLSYILQAFGTLSYISKSCTDLQIIDEGCDDIPFDEIKNILDKRFEKIDNALDKNYGVLNGVSKVVAETLETVKTIRDEMKEKFSIVISGIQDIKDVFREPEIAVANFTIHEIEKSQQEIEKRFKADGFNGNEITEKLLFNLEHFSVKDLVRNLVKLQAFEKNSVRNSLKKENAKVALACLEILHSGIVVYYRTLLFIINQKLLIANYYYEEKLFEKYNNFHTDIYISFHFLKNDYMINNHETTSVAAEVINDFDIVRNNKFIKRNTTLVKILSDRRQSLINISRDVDQIELPILNVEPPKIYSIDFTPSYNKKPLGIWVNAKQVRYAVQYKDDKMYSKIGPWSVPVSTNKKAYPVISMKLDTNMTTLLFRKIDHNPPEFVGTVTEEQFLDINRDLYDAVLDRENKAIETITTLMEYGAKVDAALDNGQTAIHLAALNDNVTLAEKCLVHNAESLKVKDNNGFTPMHIAYKKSHTNFLTMLIKKGADINAKTNEEKLTLLHMATNAQNMSLIRTLVKLPNLDVNAKDINGYTALHKAVFTNVEVVQALLSHQDIDVNANSNDYFTPLHLAVVNSKLPVINELLKRKDLKINAGNKGKLTALHFATMAGYTDIVKILIKLKEIDVNMRSIDGRTALHYAIGLKKIDIISLLLSDPRTDIYVGDEDNITPLHSAVMTGQDDVVKKLVQIGAPIIEPTKGGYTALHFSCLRNNIGLTDYLLVYPIINVEAKTKDGLTPLHFAVTHSDLNTVKLLINRKGANVNVTDNSGKSLLHKAAARGKLDIVQYLVENHHLSYSAVDKFNKSPLDLALLNKHFKIVEYFSIKGGRSFKHFTILDGIKSDNIAIIEYLVYKAGSKDKASAYLNERDRFTLETPLFDAVKYGRLNIVKYMVRNGASLKHENGLDQYPVHIAAKHGHLDIVKYFVEKNGCDPNTNTKSEGQTTLHFAVQSGNLDLVRYLIDRKGINPEIKDESGLTPLHYAVSGKLDISDSERGIAVVKYLVEKKKHDYVVKDSNGRTPFYVAAEYGNLNATIYLHNLYYTSGFRKHLTVKTYKEGNTPLIAAAGNGHTKVVKWLVEKLSNIDDVNKDNNTALHVAVRNVKFDVVKCLTEKGANVNAIGKDGTTPLHEAVWGSVEMVQYLVENNGSPYMKNKRNQTPLEFALTFPNYKLVKSKGRILTYLKSVTV